MLTYDNSRQITGTWPKLLSESIFGTLLPHPQAFDLSAIRKTKDMWKYKAVHTSNYQADIHLLDSFLHEFGVDATYKEIVNICKSCKKFDSVKLALHEVDGKSDWFSSYHCVRCELKHGIIEVCIITACLNSSTVKLTIYPKFYKKQCCSDEFLSALINKITNRLTTLQRQKYPLFSFTANTVAPIINKINNIAKLVDKYPWFRWVILVHGKPGTGKTFLFKHLQFYLDRGIYLQYHTTLVDTFKEALHCSQNHNEKPETDKLVATATPNLCNLNGTVKIPIEIIDEVDRLISSYSNNTFDTKQADTVSLWKEHLDSASGLIVLITNHLDKLDQSAIRDGRVNETIHIDVDFYSIKERRGILEFYSKQYCVDDFSSTVSDEELKDMTIARIEAICKKKMVENGMKEISN